MKARLVAALALGLASAALAADPTPEARQQMATVHQKMADCLRSERPFAECKSEMMKSCSEMKGENGCPMMGPGMMGHGMMGPPDKTPSPEKK